MGVLIIFSAKALEIPTVTDVKADDGLVSVRPAANDAYKVFDPFNKLWVYH